MKFRLKWWTFGVAMLAVSVVLFSKLLLGQLPRLLVVILETTGQFDHMLPESMMDTLNIIRLHGYPAEGHSVATPDGYILEIHRIPYGRNNDQPSKKSKRHPVFLMHGYSCSSATWLINGVENSLGFVLADAGYDVFMGNLRGNAYTKHETLTDDKDKFWKFSIDDHALLDVSSMIDYTLNITGQEKLTFIGHSMGATSILLLLSEKSEYNNKIQHLFLQAPVIFNDHGKSLLVYLARNYRVAMMWWDDAFGGEVLFRFSIPTRKLLSLWCTSPKGIFFCNYFLSLVAGFNQQNFNSERLHAFVFHMLYGASKTVNQQFSQLFLEGKQHHFDYGREENLKRYAQADPPNYNLTSITASATCYWGYMDAFTDALDVARLQRIMPPTAIFERIPIDIWNHFDFLLQRNATKYHYIRILEEMAKYVN